MRRVALASHGGVVGEALLLGPSGPCRSLIVVPQLGMQTGGDLVSARGAAMVGHLSPTRIDIAFDDDHGRETRRKSNNVREKPLRNR